MEADDALTISSDVHVEDFDDELVALHLVTEEIFVMKGAAVEFFRALRERGSRQSALEAAADHYGLEPTDIRADFDKVVAELLERGIVTP